MDPSDSADELIEMREQDGVLVVKVLPKRLDASMAPAFKAAVIHQVEAGRNLVVLDMGSVAFIDSSALGAVVSCLKAIGSRGSLAISGTQGAVLKLFKLTKLDRVLKLHDTTDAAVQSIRPS